MCRGNGSGSGIAAALYTIAYIGTFKGPVLQASCIDSHKPGRPHGAGDSNSSILDGLGLLAITSRHGHH